MPAAVEIAPLRRASLIAALALTGLAGVVRADEVDVVGRNTREERRLLDLYARTYLGEVAGFNHRHAICDQEKAQAMGDYDRAHRTTFRRTLGWRWDGAAARFVVAPPKQADVTLSFVGPIRSGRIEVGGKEVWYCRAEAPEKLVVRAKLPAPYDFESDSRVLPTLLPGFVDMVGSEHVADAAPEPGPMTPQPQIEARIAEAVALLEPKRIAPSLVPWLSSDCPEAEARDGLERGVDGAQGHMDERRYLRHGAERDAWVQASEADAEVSLEVRHPAYNGPFRDEGTTKWVCSAAMPGSATAGAHWQEEGDVTLSFTVPPPPDP